MLSENPGQCIKSRSGLLDAAHLLGQFLRLDEAVHRVTAMSGNHGSASSAADHLAATHFATAFGALPFGIGQNRAYKRWRHFGSFLREGRSNRGRAGILMAVLIVANCL